MSFDHFMAIFPNLLLTMQALVLMIEFVCLRVSLIGNINKDARDKGQY